MKPFQIVPLPALAPLVFVLLFSPLPGRAQQGPLPLDEVRFWAYQIQGLGEPGAVEALARSSYDMLVIEPTRTDWTDDRDFDIQGAVARLKAATASDGIHRKLVIAYIDIGQAEDWRWYWTWSREVPADGSLPEDWPDYILALDPDGWDGNYVVRYWDPAWKDVVMHGVGPGPDRDYQSILDEVIRDGFDGIYLDWVEGYEHEDVMAAAEAEGRDAAQEMARLIAEMRAYARERNPDFLIIQQNAAWLLDEEPELADAIDAIAQEHVFQDGVATDDWNDPQGCDMPTEAELSAEYVEALEMHLAAGIPVFNAEYACRTAPETYERSRKLGFVTYCTRRSLGELTDTPPPGLP